jgi:tricorn protease-like protein
MNTDGSDRKKMNGDNSLYMNVVVDDRIYYYGDLSGSKGIYSVKTDGTLEQSGV